MALGTASSKRGAYYSAPVYAQESEPNGVVVIKASIEVLENNIIRTTDGVTLLVGPQGMIFSASRPEMIFKTLWEPDAAELKALAESRQFGPGPGNGPG